MAYMESRCRAGRTMNYRLYYSIRYNNGKGRAEERAPKSKPTSERQAAINRKRALEHLTLTMNASFGQGDLYATFSYEKEKRPESYEEFKAQAKKLMKKLRRLYKKLGIEFRYIWVAERGKQGATHIHMVMSGIDSRLLPEQWPHGYITVKHMDPSGNYHKLAAYFIKYSDKTMRTEDKLQGKRYKEPDPSQAGENPDPQETGLRPRGDQSARGLVFGSGHSRVWGIRLYWIRVSELHAGSAAGV